MENGVGAAVSGISGIAGISGVSEVSNEVQKWTKEEADSVYGHSRWG